MSLFSFLPIRQSLSHIPHGCSCSAELLRSIVISHRDVIEAQKSYVYRHILDKIFVTRNKIFMTSKNKNIMTSLILEEMEKRGRRQVFRSEDMRLGLGFGLRFGFRFGLRFIHILPRRTWGLLYTGLF